MNTLKDFVNWKLTHADKVAEAEGHPLVMENCKKNKRMKQLEIYGNSVQDGTATPDNPIEVQSVGEPTVNLFDADLWLPYFDKLDDGSYKVKTGGVHNNNTIPFVVKAGTYTITLDIKCWKNAFYRPVIVDKDGNKYQKYIGNNDENWHTLKLTFTTEVETSHIMWNYNTPNNTLCFRNFQIQEGSTATPYEPYGKYKIPITIRGENLAQSVSVSANNYSSYSKSGNSYTIKGNVGTSECGYNTGQLMIPYASDSTISNSGISVQSGETYNISFDCLLQEIGKYNNHISLLIHYKYDSGGVGIYTKREYYPTINEIKHYNFKFTASKTEKIGLCFRINNNLVTISNIRVENADIEPITTNVFLNEPLRRIGDYADYIDGKGEKVVRKCVKKYLKDYGWGSYSSAPTDQGTHYELSHKDYSILPYVGNGGASVSKGFSNLLRCIDYYDFASAANAIFMHEWGNNIRVTLSKDYVPNGTVDDFKAWFNENNPYMIRILAEPIEEPITIDLPKLNAKTTIIEVDTSLAPSNAKGKYIKK